MKIRVFSISAHGDDAASDALDAFLSQHRIRDIDKRFVEAGASSFWSIAVTFVDGAGAQRPSVRGVPKDRVDYREVLGPDEFAVYSRLRDLRKQWAARDGVPPYHILTNEQLAALVQDRKRSRADLATLDGFGPSRLAKYGDEIVAALTTHMSRLDTPPSPRAST